MQVAFPFLQAIYLRITKISRFDRITRHEAATRESTALGVAPNAAEDDGPEPDTQHCRPTASYRRRAFLFP